MPLSPRRAITPLPADKEGKPWRSTLYHSQTLRYHRNPADSDGKLKKLARNLGIHGVKKSKNVMIKFVNFQSCCLLKKIIMKILLVLLESSCENFETLPLLCLSTYDHLHNYNFYKTLVKMFCV